MPDFLPYPRRGDVVEPYPVEIPRRYRLPAAVLIGASLLGQTIWSALMVSGEIEAPRWFVVFNVTMVTLSFLYLLPLFLGRWPAWAVRVMGRAHIDYNVRKFIEGVNRTRAPLSSQPGTRSRLLPRVTFGGLLAACFVAGLASSLGLHFASV